MGGREPLNSSSQASHFCLLGGREGERKWHTPWADWVSPDSQAVGSGRHSPTWCSRRGKPGLQKSPPTKVALLQKERKETEINKWRPKAVTNAVISRVNVYNWAEDQSLPTGWATWPRASGRARVLSSGCGPREPPTVRRSSGSSLVLSFLSLSGGDWTRQALGLALVLSYDNCTI